MKYKTLCRLLVKLVGLFFLAESVPQLLQAIRDAMLPGTSVPFLHTYTVPYFVGYLGVGLLLLALSSWITDRLIPGNRPYCHECGYDLTGTIGNVCAECGTTFKPIVRDVEPHH